MKKKIIKISKVVIFITALNIFASLVYHVSIGGNKLGFLTEGVREFAKFPFTVKQSLKQVYSEFFIPSSTRFDKVADPNFEPINLLDYNVYALNATYEKDHYQYKLTNLINDSTIHTWNFFKKDFVGEPINWPITQPLNPILLDDMSIIGMQGNLYRLDKDSNILWVNNSMKFHHSQNLSHDNHVWVCGLEKAHTKNSHSESLTEFDDALIVKINVDDGEIVFSKSLSEIFIENGYIGMVHGFANDPNTKGKDLFHLNDIQPVIEESEHWDIGDLLLSLRHRAMILHYRPKTNKIIRMIYGSFLAQHDVDIISPTEISIFNNNTTATKHIQVENNSRKPLADLKSSNVVVYNYSDSTFTNPSLSVFEKEKIYTPIQGLHEFLGNGDLFIESTEDAKRYILRGDKVIYKNFANPIKENDLTEYPHWTRIYENIDFIK